MRQKMTLPAAQKHPALPAGEGGCPALNSKAAQQRRPTGEVKIGFPFSSIPLRRKEFKDPSRFRPRESVSAIGFQNLYHIGMD
jgi:hypothetical protein